MNSIELIKQTVVEVFPFVLLAFIGVGGLILGLVFRNVVFCVFSLFLGFLCIVTLCTCLSKLEVANP